MNEGCEVFEMTYKLNPELRLIKSPIILLIDGEEITFPDGAALTEEIFDKNYIISSITTRENHIVMELKENKNIGVVNWIGEEPVSFM